MKINDKNSNTNYANDIYEIGLKYLNGHGVSKNYVVAMNYLKKAAHMGNTNAMVDIGRLYHEGLGVVKNDYEALGWYKASARKGNVDGMYETAQLYQKNTDFPDNKKYAMEFYERAANIGHYEAMFQLACLYEDEFNTFRTTPQGNLSSDDILNFVSYQFKAFHWFKKAAELGNIEAMFRVAQKYESHYCSCKKKNDDELAEALAWYLKAAESGHQEAMFQLAHIFYTGRYEPTVPWDEYTARYWFFKAANAGHYDAMFQAGIFLEREHKYSGAFKYFFKAAHAGHYDAMMKVAEYYISGFWGRGTINIEKGKFWLYQVTNCGITELENEAEEFLKAIREKEIEIEEKQNT